MLVGSGRGDGGSWRNGCETSTEATAGSGVPACWRGQHLWTCVRRVFTRAHGQSWAGLHASFRVKSRPPLGALHPVLPAFDATSPCMSPCHVCPQATSRRSSQERKTLNLWPHSSATAARPRPGETWVPSAEVREKRALPSFSGASVPLVARDSPGYTGVQGPLGGSTVLQASEGLTLLWQGGGEGRGNAAEPAAGCPSLLRWGVGLRVSLCSCSQHRPSKTGTGCHLSLLRFRGIRLGPRRALGPVPRNAPPSATLRSGDSSGEERV